MGRPYYNRIAKQWHAATGYQGGAFKRYTLNDALLERIGGLDGSSILELGAGNGYFMPLALRRYSGERPSRIVITDLSDAMLRLAQESFALDTAEYQRLDVRQTFPFDDNAFDLILATMVFNEVATTGLRAALSECRRTLNGAGRLLITITHPDFIAQLERNGKIARLQGGMCTMPGKGSLRLPVVPRSIEQYDTLLRDAGFTFVTTAVYPSQNVLNERPGLRHAPNCPLAAVYDCHKQELRDNSP